MKGLLVSLPCLYADDSSTLLSVRSVLSQESSTIESFMKGVEGRNVTQMASLMQNLVESQLFGDGVTGDAASGEIKLDSDITEALKTIKTLLLGDIQKALKHEHSVDQHAVNMLHQCWDECKSSHDEDQTQVDDLWGIMQSHKTSHEVCRESVHTKYIDKVKKCNALDIWIDALECPACFKEECVVIHDPDSRKVGDMLQAHLAWATNSYAEWAVKHAACSKAVIAHEEDDKECDKTQGHFESGTCAHRQAVWTACNVNQMTCCKRCSVEFDAEVNRVECAEKDRKIDWSATKKIECYIDVLMASPTSEELEAKCKKDGKACINQWRENKYNSCNDICVDIDFEAGDYYLVDGVNTTHRTDSSHGDRCTIHLDIHFPMQPSCVNCPPPIPGPCEFPFISTYYVDYDSRDAVNVDGVPKLGDEKECKPDQHQQWWAYSRAECRPCPELIGRTPNSEPSCFFGNQVKIFATEKSGGWLNLGEVIVNGGASSLKVTLSDTWAAPHLKDNCVDGNPSTFCHSKHAHGWWVAFTLDAPTCINQIEVINRHDGYQDRIVGAGISVINQGTEIWTDTFDENMNKYTWNLAGSQVKDTCLDWSVDKKHMVDGTCYVGAYDRQTVKKTFTGLAGNCHYKWKAVIDTWASVDNEPLTFTLNGKSYNFATRPARSCNDGWTQYPAGFGSRVGSPGSPSWVDCWKPFEAEFIAPLNGQADVSMFGAMNQHINDEAWGFHDMEFELIKCGTVVDDSSGWTIGTMGLPVAQGGSGHMQWTPARKRTVDGTTYMGGYVTKLSDPMKAGYGTTPSNQNPQKVFRGLSPGCTYKMSAVIDTWACNEGWIESMDFSVNGHDTKFAGIYQAGDERSGSHWQSCINGWTLYPNGFGVQMGSAASKLTTKPDCWKPFSTTFKADSGGMASVKMSAAIAHLGGWGLFFEAWGWHDMVFEQMSC